MRRRIRSLRRRLARAIEPTPSGTVTVELSGPLVGSVVKGVSFSTKAGEGFSSGSYTFRSDEKTGD